MLIVTFTPTSVIYSATINNYLATVSNLVIVLCVGESKVPPVLYYMYSTVQSSASLYSTAVQITQAGSDATLLGHKLVTAR